MLVWIQMDLIITGSRGFIGFNFLLEIENNPDFLERYETIFLVDACRLQDENGWVFNADAYDEFLGRVGNKFQDFSNFQQLDGMTENADILNFASESHVDDSIAKPFSLYQKNVELVPELIEAVGLDNISTFFHIRTDEEFGAILLDGQPFDKNSKLNPNNPYSASKSSQYLFLSSLEKTFGLNFHCFCLANQYGPYQHHSKMIPATISRIQKDKPALVYGSGKECREWTYVGDTVKQIRYLMDYKSQRSREHAFARNMFISNPMGFTTNLELVQRIISIMGKGEIEFVDNRKGHDFAYKLKTDFNLPTNLQTGLEQTINHYAEANTKK